MLNFKLRCKAVRGVQDKNDSTSYFMLVTISSPLEKQHHQSYEIFGFQKNQHRNSFLLVMINDNCHRVDHSPPTSSSRRSKRRMSSSSSSGGSGGQGGGSLEAVAASRAAWYFFVFLLLLNYGHAWLASAPTERKWPTIGFANTQHHSSIEAAAIGPYSRNS